VRLLQLAMCWPLSDETLAFLLDDAGNGGVIVSVTGTQPLEAVLDITDQISEAGSRTPGVSSIVVASVRPHHGLLPGDIDRWLEASDIAEAHGITLIEWYVVGRRGFFCPRDLLGEPPRWHQ
jgi:hypothetical protein